MGLSIILKLVCLVSIICCYNAQKGDDPNVTSYTSPPPPPPLSYGVVPTSSPSPAPSPVQSPSPAPSPVQSPSPAPSPVQSPSPAPSPVQPPSPAPSPVQPPSPAPSPPSPVTVYGTPPPPLVYSVPPSPLVPSPAPTLLPPSPSATPPPPPVTYSVPVAPESPPTPSPAYSVLTPSPLSYTSPPPTVVTYSLPSPPPVVIYSSPPTSPTAPPPAEVTYTSPPLMPSAAPSLSPIPTGTKLSNKDVELLNMLLKVEYTLAQCYVCAAFGDSVDAFVTDLHANESDAPPVKQMMIEFTAHQLEQISAIAAFLKQNASGRPVVNLKKNVFSTVLNAAFGEEMVPPFDPFSTPENILLTSFIISPLAPSLAASILPELEDKNARVLVAGTLGALASEDAAIRTMLFLVKDQRLTPYASTVGVFSQKIAELHRLLGVDCAEDAIKGGNSMMLMGFSKELVSKRSPANVLNMLTELGIIQAL